MNPCRTARRAVVFILLCIVPALHAAPKEDQIPLPSPSVGKILGDPQVVRGGTCEIRVRGIVMPRDNAEFQIRKGPAHGSLEGPTITGRDTAVYIYRHDGSEGPDFDRVEFKIKTGPSNTWSPLIAKIGIAEPTSRLVLQTDSLDFGEVPIGQTRVLPVRVRNGGGGILVGRLQAGTPWLLEGGGDFELAENRSTEIPLVFAPDGPGTREGRVALKTTAGVHFIEVRGEGTYRFDVPERIAFEKIPGRDALEFFVTNLTTEDLTISIEASAPLIAERSIVLPPGGRVPLRLGLEKRHYSEKFVDLALSDGPAIRKIRVDLPPPPALLEWASANGTIDLGEIPRRNIPRPTVELLNRGWTTATVQLREGEGGLAPDAGQDRTFELGPGETADIRLVWRISAEQGATAASLVASEGGLDHVLRATATIVAPVVPEKSSSEPESAPAPEATPPPARVLTGQEKKELALRRPYNIGYRVTPAGRVADAEVTWNYSGPEPVLFWLEKKVVDHSRPDLGDTFQRRLQVPEDLPKQENVEKWELASSGKNAIRRLGNGAWSCDVRGLKEGFHDLRLATRAPPDGKRIDYVEFVVRVDPLPPNPLWKGLAGAIGFFCLLYLLRKKIRRWFGRAPEKPEEST